MQYDESAEKGLTAGARGYLVEDRLTHELVPRIRERFGC
jgi:hypothetical protein